MAVNNVNVTAPAFVKLKNGIYLNQDKIITYSPITNTVVYETKVGIKRDSLHEDVETKQPIEMNDNNVCYLA